MTKTLKEVHAFWEDAARQPLDGDGLRPTARDPYLQEVVESMMETRLDGGRLLDVGCGDGLSTLRFARRVDSVVGVDYVAGFVERARGHAQENAVTNASFEQGDVMNLAPVRERHAPFDNAVSIRCLINLASRENQMLGLEEIARCIKPGGFYLTSEGWTDGIDGLNARRRAVGLSEMGMTDYNVLMPRAQFEAAAEKHFVIEDYLPLGFYLFVSRVLMPAYAAPEPPRHTHPLNRVAAEFQIRGGVHDEFEDCDYAGIYLLRRK